jgi:ATP-dependent 26S proteasome regulatory subunit
MSGARIGIGNKVRREQIVFPAGVLERIERHTKTFAEHAEALRASGRHLKRGLLLHGPPGTGKTLTAMYLSHLMPDRTVLLLTGEALHAVGPACRMARQLAPSMLVLEDVDLVAENREYGEPTSLLFELLNEMDGLGEDTDIVFVLTTNRPDAIEPALAPRPGRVDLAVAMPLRLRSNVGCG